MAEFGYAGEILKVDLSNHAVSTIPTSVYAERFMGGRGIAAKICWDEVTPETKAYDPGNEIIFITGLLAGFTRLSGSRWLICGKTSLSEPEAYSYGNAGGSWGAWLKFAGYDGVVVRGRADKPVYIFIDDSTVEICDASSLWGKTSFQAHDILKAELGRDTRVAAIGQAGENLVSFATVNACDNSSASGGFGAVMGSKMLKAIAVRAREKKRPVAAEPDRLKALADHIYVLKVENREDLGPPPPMESRRVLACFGCVGACPRMGYKAEDGKVYKYFCQASGVYQQEAIRYYGEWNEIVPQSIRLIDGYGLDTAVMGPVIQWLRKCYEEGILQEEETGLPFSRMGSYEFLQTLVEKISFRDGFGDILARGPVKAARSVGDLATELIVNAAVIGTGEMIDYDPRIMPVNGLLYATEPRRPIQQLHNTSIPFWRWIKYTNGLTGSFLTAEILQDIAEKLWGSRAAVDFSSYEGKALAAKYIQDHVYIKESLGLCDLSWPIYQVMCCDDQFGLLRIESQIVSAVTGMEMDEKELLRTGERNFNLQRAILMSQGWNGREGDKLVDYLYKEPLQGLFFDPECMVMGRNGEKVSIKGAVVKRDEFERLKGEYYQLRGWDAESGFQTKTGLEELGLDDVAEGLEKMGLLR